MIKIHLSVNPQDGEAVASRFVEVELLSTPKLVPGEPGQPASVRDHDEVNTYSATLYSPSPLPAVHSHGHSVRVLKQATFQHRYGDPLEVICAKALAALADMQVTDA